MELGIRLPTPVDPAGGDAHAIAERAARVEELGFSSVWCMDHLLRADYGLGAATLDPVTVLPVLLTATRAIAVGTALLIAPLRQPVWLLKQLGSLSALGGERVLIGLGAGWERREFAAVGVPRSERRQRLDLVLRSLATARDQGELRLGAELIEPAPARLGGVYVGGGSSTVSREGTTQQRLAPSVLARIADADGWIARSTASPEQLRADLDQIEAARTRAQPLRVLRTSFLNLSTQPRRDRAIEEQLAAYRAAGWSGSRAEFERTQPAGTIGDVLAQIAELGAHGVSALVVQPVGDPDRQLGLIGTELLAAAHAIGGPTSSAEGGKVGR